MTGLMTRDSLVADLKRSVHDAAGVFDAPGDADWLRILGTALTAMQDKRPRTLLGSVDLQADEPVYALAPASVPDFAAFKTYLWASRPLKPWAPGYPGALPRVSAVQSGGAWQLAFDPAPCQAHLNAYGSSFKFWYYGVHKIGEEAAATTLDASDRPLLLLRAQAEVMRELTLRNVNKPVQLRDGFSGTPRNSTPAALYEALLNEWREAQ
ncbi:MAG: hypothetical protein C0423_19800 [Methylibium sp.]|nr:hypothetical protein [Methylibium sp.]